MKRDLKVSVRQLVEFVCRSGDLETGFSGMGRAVEAIRVHQMIQQSRPEGYAAEVPVVFHFENHRFTLTVGGRIDGIYPAPEDPSSQNILLEEIKTSSISMAEIEKQENILHWSQLKVYAFIYAAEHHLRAIDVQLTYYHFDSGEIAEFRRSFDFTELDVFFRDLVKRYLHWADTLVQWQTRRDASIGALGFPFEEYRPGQRRLAVEVYRTVRTHGQLLAQAATGIGKTVAVIFPSIKALGEGWISKIFYLTARTTARLVSEKSIDDLRTGGLRIKSVTLTAKDKICFNPEGACTAEECEFARGYYDRLGGALPEVFRKDGLTREQIEKFAREFRLCPFELSLDVSLYADIIVCDYNYVFDPRVHLRRFFASDSAPFAFLIDEAHNLVDRAREMFSAEIFKQSFLEVRRNLKKTLPGLFTTMGKINAQLSEIRRRGPDERQNWSEQTPPQKLFPLLRAFLKQADRWLSGNEKAAFREELLGLYFAVSAFMRVSEKYDRSYVTCYERRERDFKVKLFCVDPSGQLKEALMRGSAAVFFSATLTPADYFKTMLGCSQSALKLTVPSPFPPQNLAVYVTDHMSTYFKERQRTAPDIARLIREAVYRQKGNYLAFFPSYAYMQMIFEIFGHENPGVHAIIQKPDMDENQRNTFLEHFEQERENTLVGFAVMGGIFGEGIDLVGDRLCGAIIVGVGLPGISLEREVIRQYFAEKLNAGFEFAYQFPGINRVLQAAGRVIRSEADQGVVLLIDRRYGTRRYKSLLPEEWMPVRIRHDSIFQDHLTRFWGKSK